MQEKTFSLTLQFLPYSGLHKTAMSKVNSFDECTEAHRKYFEGY